MNKKGIGLFQPVFTVIVLFVMILILFHLGGLSVDPNAVAKVGDKQRDVFDAYQRGVAVQLYAQEALIIAVEQVEANLDLDISYEDQVISAFTTIMRSHQQELIDVPFLAEIDGEDIVVRSARAAEVPVGTVIRREGTGSLPGVTPTARSEGFFDQWPVKPQVDENGQVRPNVVTSMFGERNFSGPGSINHPGLDLRARVGTQILSVDHGKVTSIDRTHTCYQHVEVEMDNGWTCKYIHVTPTSNVQLGMRVQKADVIGTAQDMKCKLDAHLHLECYNHVNVLTPADAETLFGDRHVSPAGPKPPAEVLIATKSGHSFLDPYCLFTPQLQSQLSVSEKENSGFKFRSGETKNEKLLSTCSAYVAKGVLTANKNTPEASDNRDYTVTLQRLQDLDLLTYIDEVGKQEGVDPQLIIAMIATESTGDPRPDDKVGICGLMQVGGPAAQDAIGTNDPNVYCENKQNILAGTRHMKKILEKYERDGYLHKIAFMAAEYNTGGIFYPWVARVGENPSFEEVLASITPDDFRACADCGYLRNTDAELQEKIDREIARNGHLVSQFYEVGGGAVVPVDVTTEKSGFYRFDIKVRTPHKQERHATITGLRHALRQVQADAVGATIRSFGFDSSIRCTPTVPAEATLANAINTCTEQFETRVCSCELELPGEEVNTIILREELLTVDYTDAQDQVQALTWITVDGDATFDLRFNTAGKRGPQALVRNTDSWSVQIDGQVETTPLTSHLYVTPFEVANPTETLEIDLTPAATRPVCPTTELQRYCIDDYEFWVSHPTS